MTNGIANAHHVSALRGEDGSVRIIVGRGPHQTEALALSVADALYVAKEIQRKWATTTPGAAAPKPGALAYAVLVDGETVGVYPQGHRASNHANNVRLAGTPALVEVVALTDLARAEQAEARLTYWYLPDGTTVTLAPEEVTARRIAAAKEIADLRADVARLREALDNLVSAYKGGRILTGYIDAGVRALAATAERGK